MQHVLDKIDKLTDWLAEHGQPAFRANQVRQWLFEKRAEQFQEMSNLPKELRAQLAESFEIWTATTAERPCGAVNGCGFGNAGAIFTAASDRL